MNFSAYQTAFTCLGEPPSPPCWALADPRADSSEGGGSAQQVLTTPGCLPLLGQDLGLE